MKYDLAKELKEAGFPQLRDTRPGVACIPTLEELIEACGDGFFNLQNNGALSDDDKRWTSSGGIVTAIEGLDIDYVRNAPMPREAVALLWLALNKKD